MGRDASSNAIKSAYRKLAMKYHPDRNPGDKQAEASFKEASVAAEVLLDEQKRARYDQFGHAGVEGQASGGFQTGDFGDLGDIFGDIFGDILGGGRRRRGTRSQGRPGNDLQTSLSLSFEEAAFGVEKNLSITRLAGCHDCNGTGAKRGSQPQNCGTCEGLGEVRRQQGFFTVATTCPRCHGSGQVIGDPCGNCHGEGRKRRKTDVAVTVPAGIDSGQRLKLSDKGDSGTSGAPSGDLYVVIDVKEHELFERDGFDIHCTIPISFSQAALGCEIEVPTLSGRVQVPIQAGIQSNKKMRLRGKGVQKLGGYGTGDQVLTIHVETPSALSSEQKELFKRLSKLEEKDRCNPMGQNFFDKVKGLFH